VSAVGAACLAAAVACLVVGLVALRALRRRLELVGRAEHELRGPATALALACERMRRDPGAAPHAMVLEAQLERLRAGLEDLAAARRGRRAAGGTVSPVELAPFVRAALEPWRSALRRCSLDWRAGPATALADRGRLAQALGNLLANSAEHGAGELDVRARRMPGGIRLEFRNRNRRAGPSPGEGAARFEPPGRGVAPTTVGEVRGNGVGIASQAARDAGGRLLVDVQAAETLAVLDLPEPPASDPASVRAADDLGPGSGAPGPDLAA
jgi:signal transduction histidine kinase